MEWNYENVQNFIIPYPKHGQLDEWREGMEDEATSDVEEDKWLPDDGTDSVVAEAPDDIASDVEPDEFDPEDWREPETAREKFMPTQEELDHHCRGGQNTHLLDAAARLRTLKDAEASIGNLHTATSYSLVQTIGKVIRFEEKRLVKLSRSNPNVNIRLQENIRAEDARKRRMRKELLDLMSCKRKQLDLKAQIEKAKAITKQSEMTLIRSRAVVKAMTDVRAFSASQCGQGKKGGGNKEHKANRVQVLERMRRFGNLTQDQTTHWDFFIHNWDEQRLSLIHI